MNQFWRDTDRSAVTVQEAMGEWSLVAWDVLEEVARRWRRTITEERLAVEVQRRSGIVTSLPDSAWLPTVVSLVALRAHESRGPQLTAFVVNSGGDLPEGYGEVLELEGQPTADATRRRQHSLEARTVAHRAYGARVPAGGSLAEEPTTKRRSAATGIGTRLPTAEVPVEVTTAAVADADQDEERADVSTEPEDAEPASYAKSGRSAGASAPESAHASAGWPADRSMGASAPQPTAPAQRTRVVMTDGRSRKPAPQLASKVCPRCWIQLPATGRCDNCD